MPQTFDIVTNVEQIGQQGYTQFTIVNVAGDVLYYADNGELTIPAAQGSLTAGQSATFTAPVFVRSASRTTLQVAWASPAAASSGTVATALDGGSAATPNPSFSVVSFTGIGGILLMSVVDGGDSASSKPIGQLNGGTIA